MRWAVWAAVVALAALGGRAQLSRDMHELLSDMDEMKELAAVNYSTPVVNTTYRASVEFDMRAMGPLYNCTHLVIDAIAHRQAYPPGIVSVSDGHLEVASLRDNWRPLLAHYAGPTAVITVALLLAASLPLAGLFWCCCYWCRVGRRRRPFDRKYDACLKGLLAIILIALLTLFLFGVVCVFASDSQVEEGAAGAAGAARAGLRDAREFLNATQAHARWLLVNNYGELAERLNTMLVASGAMVSMKLGEFSRAVSVTTLNNLVQRLDGVQADLQAVRAGTARLRSLADRLNSGLRNVKSHLLHTLADCDQPKCVALQQKYNIGQLNTEIQYSQMPDVSELLSNVTALLATDIKKDVGAGQLVLRDIQIGIRRSVQDHIPAVQAQLAATGQRLERVADEISWLAGNASRALQRRAGAADSLQALHARYGPYRRYAGLAAAAAPLLITVVMAWGLTCGVCGKRPDVYGASDCCNKGAGSKCLLCGIGLIFILGGAMCLVLAVYFLVGVTAQRFICDPLTEPRGNRLFEDLEKILDLEKELFNERREPEFDLTHVMLRCHANLTVYNTLQLSRLYDLAALRGELGGAVAARVAALRPAFPPQPATILSPAAKGKLQDLAASGLSEFDFERILHALESNMTSLALDSLGAQLDSTARSLQQPAFSAEAAALRRAAATLRDLVRDVLHPMLNTSDALNSTAIRLRDSLRLNHRSLNEAISYLMKECAEAEVFLNRQGPERLQNITQEYAAVITEKLNEYLERVTYAAENEVGRCGPLSNAFNATRDAACNKILMPTNGYWMSLAWCVVLFVPLMVVAQRLARLYLHADPYPGPLVEAEYLYDAYADRDNVPLANAYKAEKRGGRGGGGGRAREGEAAGAGGAGAGGGGGGGGGPGGGARAEPRGEVAPPLDAHHARRYNDMAPKHWEEGPPRYHGPTEYERPPPYYYPGPNVLPRVQLHAEFRRRRAELYYYDD